jgi:hypothetical protein
MNVKWHEQHVMPARATLEQRIAWHREHQLACACRPIPAKLRGMIEGGGRQNASTSHLKFSKLVEQFSGQPAVTYGGKGFGSSALKLHGKIFAMLTSKQEFVIKLSRERAAELVESAVGSYFDPGRGRLMKEWVVVPESSKRWLELAREAQASASAEAPAKKASAKKASAKKASAKKARVTKVTSAPKARAGAR